LPDHSLLETTSTLFLFLAFQRLNSICDRHPKQIDYHFLSLVFQIPDYSASLNIHTIFEIRTDFEINKYKYHRKLNVGLAVYTAADLGA